MSTPPEADTAQDGPSRIEWWHAIRTSALPQRERLLALVMSTYMDPDGTRCFPGQDTLAKACGWDTDRTVRRGLKGLTEAGYVVVLPHAGQRADGRAQATHRYVPTLPSHDQPDSQESSRTGRPAGQSGVQQEHDQPDTWDDQPDTSGRPAGQSGVHQPHQDLTKDPPTPADARGADGACSAGEDRGGGLLRDVLDRLRGHGVRRTTPGHRRLRKACRDAAAAGWTAGPLVSAILDADRDLGPLSDLNSADPDAVTAAVATRIVRAGLPPAPPAPLTATACPTCAGAGVVEVDAGTYDRCPSCTPLEAAG